tara:strand:+ start:5213 stop:6784 length:1572 start_codon:yes stop_codon:yes gene_type:complete
MAIIEVKYFNTFLIKKLKNVVAANPQPISPYADVPASYAEDNPNPSISTDWYVEESRIRGGYNNLTVDFGVKAYLDEENPNQQHRFNSLIYSGIFNSRTGVNNTNQFSVAEDIVKSADPSKGSIQKLYAEDTNLIIFQEDKVSRALIDKDAIYSAEGNAAITSTQLVIGQIVAYAGEYGISKDPFSFAVYGYRKYFTDKKRGVVLRLSRDGMTEISSYGMHDFFRDTLNTASVIRGAWDNHNKNYIISTSETNTKWVVQSHGGSTYAPGTNVSVTLDNPGSPNITAGMYIYSYTAPGLLRGVFYGKVNSVTSNTIVVCDLIKEITPATSLYFQDQGYNTLAFDESVLGWTSFFSYKPTFITSLISSFYSFFNGKMYLHNSGSYGKYYDFIYNSDVTVVLNSEPSAVKNFKTINYEGANGWELQSMVASSSDVSLPIGEYTLQTTLGALESNIFANNFKKKENKFFANLINNSQASGGEILWGQASTGLKGFWSTVKVKLVNANYLTTKKELFAISSDIVQSSY